MGLYILPPFVFYMLQAQQQRGAPHGSVIPFQAFHSDLVMGIPKAADLTK